VTRRRTAWGVVGLGAALAVAGVAAGVGAGLDHAEARERWREMSTRLLDGQDGYDATESDRRYARSETHLERVRTLAEVAGAGLLLVALGAGALRRRAAGATGPAPATRLLVATLLDGSIVAVAHAALLLAAAAVDGPMALRAGLGSATPFLAFAAFAGPLAAGASPALALLRVRATPPDDDRAGPFRAALAGVLLPLAVLWAAVGILPLLALALTRGIRHPAWVAPHLAGAGYRLGSPEPDGD